MTQRKSDLGSRFASFFELPGDVVLNIPRLTLIGNTQMSVENHRGIIKYDPCSIVLGAGGYQVLVEGDDLVIGAVSMEQVTIRGNITRITFET